MEELYKHVGGFGGVVSLLAVAAALWWRFKVPQIGIELLQRELEVHRHEIAEADKDRQAQRKQIRDMRDKLREIEADYIAALVECEKLKRALRNRDRLLAEHRISLSGEEE